MHRHYVLPELSFALALYLRPKKLLVRGQWAALLMRVAAHSLQDSPKTVSAGDVGAGGKTDIRSAGWVFASAA